MNLILQSLTHGPLLWKEELPANFKGWRLPGGNLQTAEGEFGSVCIQEYQTEYFSIRFNVFDLLERFVIQSTIQGNGLFSRFMMKGQVSQQTDGGKEYTLHQNMFSLLKRDSSLITDSYTKKLHLSFDTFFSFKLIKELLPFMPQLGKWWNGSLVKTTPCWADGETNETIHSILYCKYLEDLRHYYFKSRVSDLLFGYLVQIDSHDAAGKQPTEKEIQAAYQAEQIISQDISKHTYIPELAKKVLLNEFDFKVVFKKIYGTGPYEYLVRLRMKKAIEWLDAGLSVKQVAAQTGYSSSDFTSAFINFYHFTPSSVKKRRS